MRCNSELSLSKVIAIEELDNSVKMKRRKILIYSVKLTFTIFVFWIFFRPNSAFAIDNSAIPIVAKKFYSTKSKKISKFSKLRELWKKWNVILLKFASSDKWNDKYIIYAAMFYVCFNLFVEDEIERLDDFAFIYLFVKHFIFQTPLL